jgi:hypothetical protein
VKPFRDDCAIIVDLNGDPLITLCVIEVNGCVAFRCQTDGNPKRPVAVVNEQDAAISGSDAQDSDSFALRIDKFNSADPQTFSTRKSDDQNEGQSPKQSQRREPKPQPFVAHKNRPLSIATPLKTLTPSVKPFYVADEPVEGSEP